MVTAAHTLTHWQLPCLTTLALQCIVRLLGYPDLVRLSPRNPLFNWRFVYEQHPLNFILANISDAVRESIAAAV